MDIDAKLRQIDATPPAEPTGDLLGSEAPVPSWQFVDIPVRLYDAVRELYPDSKPPFRARPFDVQIIGAVVLYEGRIAEMKTGEGRTIVAPLATYLASLGKAAELDVELCLPGHRSLIENCGKRIEELVEHHRVRANEVISILTGQRKTAYETAGEMTWDIVARSWEDFPIMQRWFATGEAIAHLRYIEAKGLIERETVDGQVLYWSDGASSL